MAGSDWQKCKFLESRENLKPLVKMRFARETSACLQQGRLFYEAAESFRPLQQFYGAGQTERSRSSEHIILLCRTLNLLSSRRTVAALRRTWPRVRLKTPAFGQ